TRRSSDLGRRWRDRHHCSGVASVLRPLQPHSCYLGWQDSHLPVLGPRTRPGCLDAVWWQRRRDGRVHPSRRREQRRAPPYRRAGIHPRVENDGAYRRIAVSYQLPADSALRDGHYQASFPFGLPQSISAWRFSRVTFASSCWSLSFFFAGLELRFLKKCLEKKGYYIRALLKD